MKVAVIAHAGKTFGGGLPDLRRALASRGVSEPIWHEAPKSKLAPREVQRVLKNLLATNLRIRQDIEEAVQTGLTTGR